MSQSPIYSEARRLWRLGAAVHWLHKRQKRPIESGWGSGPRKDWDYLKQTYIEGLNVGIRLGTPSKIKGAFLAVVDVDVKSQDKRHRIEALTAAKSLLGKSHGLCPVVTSGRGNGSRHYYCLTAEPFKTWNPAQSTEKVKVFMPSKKPSKAELSQLTEKEIGEGIRIGPAWEISLYSEGRQVVIPPSIHPDSGKPYMWIKPWISVDNLTLVEFPTPTAAPSEATPGRLFLPPLNDDFKAVPVELWQVPISDQVFQAILHGKDVTDRSGYLLVAASALHSAGLNKLEILSVLTDRDTFLGACAYDHAKTLSRAKAAAWLERYTITKVLKERDAALAFKSAPKAESGVKTLEGAELDEQNKELAEGHNWRKELSRCGKDGEGPPRSTIENVVLILSNTVAKDLVKRNEFAWRDSYICDTPWGSKADAIIQDDDMPRIAYWLGHRWRFEPPRRVIEDALVVLACKNSFDPVRDWLDGLAKWDGQQRLNTWLRDHFEAQGDPVYLAQVFAKWLTAMVRRVYEPGSKFDWMPIFEGSQGVGKSSFGRVLVGDKFFLDWLPNLADKDSMQSLQGNWAVEMGELSQFRKNELEAIKAFITRTVDKFRPPYGRRLQDSPRRCVFFGTTNRKTYLIDDTGNRRFKPVEVGRLDFETLRAERDQLFAEAIHLYRTKYNTDLAFELTGQAKVYEAIIHQEKMVEDESDLMVELMRHFIEKEHEKEGPKFSFAKFQISQILGVTPVFASYPRNIRNAMFLAKALKKLGGVKWKSNGVCWWNLQLRDTFCEKVALDDFY